MIPQTGTVKQKGLLCSSKQGSELHTTWCTVTAKPTVTITRTPNPQGLSLTTEDLKQQVTTTNSHAPCKDVQTQVLHLSSGPLGQDS